jgi:hypothetical protein
MRRRLLIRRQRGPPNEGLIFPTPSFRDVLWPSERWPALASIWRGAGARTRRAGHRPREVSSRATRTERVRVVCSVGGRTARRVARHVARADRGGRHWSHSRGEHLRATHRAAPTGAEVESSAVRSPSARRKRDVRRTCRASRVQVRDRAGRGRWTRRFPGARVHRKRAFPTIGVCRNGQSVLLVWGERPPRPPPKRNARRNPTANAKRRTPD